MKTFFYLTILIFTMAMLIAVSSNTFSYEDEDEINISSGDLTPYNTAQENILFNKKESKLEGYELEIKYFEDWHYPYGAQLPKEVMDKMWAETESMPSENEIETGDGVVNSWRQIGPYGSVNEDGARFSGRIIDIEVGNTVNPLMATASGGLWGYVGFIPVGASEKVTSLAIGSVASYPGNPSTILIGTGEPIVRSGTGMWRTTNSGVNWTHIDITPDPGRFYKIRHQTFFTEIVHAATTTGYYRSTNGGLNWSKRLMGISDKGISDIAINPINPNIIYAGKWGDGIYKSTNNGVNWAKVTTPGIPTTDVGRVSLTIGTSNPDKIYVLIDSDANEAMKGIYMSNNDGASWSIVSPPENIFGKQGLYDNVIEVCPTNSNIVLAGGVRLWRSVNSGTTWTKLVDPDIHSDQHAIEWTADGSTVYIGNDGGVAVSYDQGITYSTALNYIPVTQYVNFDVGESNSGVIYGGSQDNGLTGTTNGGESWNYTKGGDGGGVAVDPISALNVYATSGFYLGDYPFKIYKSTDKGLTWDTNHTGIEPFDKWWTKMRSDRTNPVKLYTSTDFYVYESTNSGESWNKLNNSPFPQLINSIGVSKYTAPKAIIYAALKSENFGSRIRVYEGGSFSERSNGIPDGLEIRDIITHQSNTNTAYALINGLIAGEKVYKTTNRGINWTNISGNLPDVPVGGLVPNKLFSNYLYLGTEAGCYKTTNAGVSWHRWNNGMPEAAIVTEMKWIDSTLENGKKYVIASTYGRSMWVREVSGDDPPNELSLTMFIQGFYNTGTNRLVRDTVTVYLRNSFSPYSLIDSAKGYLTNTGKADLIFENVFPGSDYFIHLKHRNSLETWSSETINFSDPTVTYNFTDSHTKAYGNNQILINPLTTKYAVYNGDVNHDGVIDVSDGSEVDNDSFSGASGYIMTDVNGDNIVDVADASLVDNNSFNGIFSIHP